MEWGQVKCRQSGISELKNFGFIPVGPNSIAVNFYRSLGFEVLGAAADWAPGRTMDNSDIVLRRILS